MVVVLSTVAVLATGCAVETPPEETAAGRDAPEIVHEMIEAHGGYEPWAEARTVQFTDEMMPPGAESGRPTRVTVEQDARRAYITIPGEEAWLAWDGDKAWGVNWESGPPPRFLALLNYYFVNLPWLTLDPGVNLEEQGTKTLWDDTTRYHLVRMTFDPGVGDTPEDYYDLYIDPRTKRLHATEYVVTYDSLLPEGVEHSPPHMLVYDEYTEVDGLVVPSHYSIYELDRAPYASCDLRDWSFDEPFDESRMTMPEGAVVDTTRP